MDRSVRHCTGGGDQNHPKEKEMAERKSHEDLQIGEKRREAKGKGKRKRHSQWNAVPETTKER